MSDPFQPHVVFGFDPMWVSLSILIATYAAVIAGRHNRAVVALIGAAAAVLVGTLDQNEALRGIDWDTIGLLAGMMILVAISRRSGLFQYLAIWSAQRVNASPAGILLMLQIVTALLSTLLNNVSTVLLIVPVTLVIAEELELDPYPFLFAEVFASNIGGTATLIGDPPNILIGSLAGLDFNAFLRNVAPAAVLVMIVQAAMVHLVWGRALRASPESRVLVMGMNAPGMITDWVLLRRSVTVMVAVLAAFVFARPLQARAGDHRARRRGRADAARQLASSRCHGRRTMCRRPLPKSIGPRFSSSSACSWWCTRVEVIGLLQRRRGQAGDRHRWQHRRGRRHHPLAVGVPVGRVRQHPVRRHHDPADQGHGGALRRSGRHRAALVVPVARRLSRR